jgi:hypothetical protein
MDNRDKEVAKAKRDWIAIVEAQARSQKTAADFCREQGITYHTFLYHRWKIQKMSRQGLAIARSTSLAPITRNGGFLPIRVEGGSSIRLRFPSGVVVESEALPAAAWVVELAQRWNGEGES